MSLEQNGAKLNQQQEAEPPTTTHEMPQSACQLSDAELQERYRREYMNQLKQMSCPGCGEDFSLF